MQATSSSGSSSHLPIFIEEKNDSPSFGQRNLFNNIDGVFVSTFDVDRGATLIHTYPPRSKMDAKVFSDEVGFSENQMAESMLTDGTDKFEFNSSVFMIGNSQISSSHTSTGRSRTSNNQFKSKQPLEAIVQFIDDIDISDWLVFDPPSSSEPSPNLNQLLSEDDDEDIDPDLEPVEDDGLRYCLSLVHTQKDNNAKRGARIIAVAIVTRLPYFYSFLPLLHICLKEYFASPKQFLFKDLYNSINTLDLSVFENAYKSPKRWRILTLCDERQLSIKSHFQNTSHTLSIPFGKHSHFSLSQFLSEFSVVGALTIYDAVLLEKEILVVGNGMPSSVICAFALGLASLTAPQIQTTKDRIKPYVSIGQLNELEENNGWIAGTANPQLEKILKRKFLKVDLQTKKINWSEKANLNFFRSFLPTQADVDCSGFTELLEDALSMNLGEKFLRKQFIVYTQLFLDLVQKKDVIANVERQKQIEIQFKPRIQEFILLHQAKKKNNKKHLLSLMSKPNSKSVRTCHQITDLTRQIKLFSTCKEKVIPLLATLNSLAVTGGDLESLLESFLVYGLDFGEIVTSVAPLLEQSLLIELQSLNSRLIFIVNNILSISSPKALEKLLL